MVQHRAEMDHLAPKASQYKFMTGQHSPKTRQHRPKTGQRNQKTTQCIPSSRRNKLIVGGIIQSLHNLLLFLKTFNWFCFILNSELFCFLLSPKLSGLILTPKRFDILKFKLFSPVLN